MFVTGGTGAIGRPAVHALIDAGHDVTGLARRSTSASVLERAGATAIPVSLFDTNALADALQGHDAVVNLATALPATYKFTSMRAWRDNIRIRTEGSQSVVTAARRAGVGTLVQESVAMVYPDCGARWITEEQPPDRYPMAESNLAAEASTQRFTDQGGTGVVLRFGWFQGATATHSAELLQLARRGICVQIGPEDAYVASIHVTDGGRAVEAALGVPAGVYNVVDDEPLTTRAYADAMAAAAGRRCRVRLPGRAAALLGHRTTSLRRSLRVSNAKLRQESPWRPRFPSAREGWHETARALDE